MRPLSVLALVASLITASAADGGDDVPPNPDKGDRILLLGPAGPIVLEANILLYGKPFRSYREKLIDHALRQGDSNGDGKATWDEALENPRFRAGRAQFSAANDQQRKAYVRQYDRNKDGLVDREEARLFLAQSGGEFQVSANFNGALQPDILGLLDADKDGTLSAEELAGAADRLKSRDVNDNDVVEPDELGTDTQAAYRVKTRAGLVTTSVRRGAVYPLGEMVNQVAINFGLKQRYAQNNRLTADCFPSMPGLVESLDRNGNKAIDPAELDHLRTIPPHVSVELHLGQADGVASGIRFASIAAELSKAPLPKEFAAEAAVQIAGTRLRITAAGFGAAATNFESQANARLAQYDADKNGYIDRKEIAEAADADSIEAQFVLWDDNGDGKVFLDELRSVLERDADVDRSRITVSSGDRGPVLFSLIDQNGDQRLGLREIHSAAERLKTLDQNRDGRVTPDEMPAEIVVTFAGGAAERPVPPAVAADAAATPANLGANGPGWFERMDRNGDGDLTPREFLGTAEQFTRIDRNKDGFIDRTEAEEARKDSRP